MRRIITILVCAIFLSCQVNYDKQPDPPSVVSFDTVAIVINDSIEGRVFLDTVVVEQEPEHELYTPPIDSVVYAIYMSQVGVREATGNNDGKDVEKYLRSVGLGKGYAWCAAFVRWTFDSAGVKTTITAWSPTAENKKNIVYAKGSFIKDIQRSDVFTIYYSGLKRIGHTGFVNGRFGMKSIETTEGNTNGNGSREGNGVYVKIRPLSSIHSISRWH